MSASDDPSRPFTLLNEGQQAIQAGSYKDALASLLEAFALAPEQKEIQSALFETLACTDGYQLPPVFTDAIAKVAEHQQHDIQALASVIRNKFDCDEDIEALLDKLDDTEAGSVVDKEIIDQLEAIFSDRLTQLILTKAISISPEIEALLVTLRKLHLNAWAADKLADTPATAIPDMLPLLASQCFNTGYVYAATVEEMTALVALQEKIVADGADAEPMLLSLAASYAPLAQIVAPLNAQQLEQLNEKANDWQPFMRLLWRQQILEISFEATIASNLQQLTPIPDAVPGSLREQYETFSYPQWQTLNLHSKQSLKAVYEANIKASDRPEIADGPVDILVAGCGTGRQVISLANTIDYKNMLAVDISAASVAYGYRKAQEYSVENVHFALADIAQMGSWEAAFDLIVCTGVLHHMHDPSAGLANLQNVSKPNSTYLLALYSERARLDVKAARDYINELGLEGTLEDIRSIRQSIRDLPFYHSAARVALTQEFYSTSGLHDYIFNKREICYTPVSLASLLKQHNLRFLGFHSIRPDYEEKYRQYYPDDPEMTNLENWDKFEEKYPDVFGEMMQFWCCNA